MRLLWQPGRACLNRSEQVSGFVRSSELNFLVWFQTIMTEDLSSAPRHHGIRSNREEVLQEPPQLSREELEMFMTQVEGHVFASQGGRDASLCFQILFLHCFLFLFPGAG